MLHIAGGILIAVAVVAALMAVLAAISNAWDRGTVKREPSPDFSDQQKADIASAQARLQALFRRGK